MKARMIFGIIVVLFGLNVLFDFPFFEILFALFIIWLGYKMITGSHGDSDFEDEEKLSGDSLNKVLIFSGTKTKFTSLNFRGGELVTIFGGAEVDAADVSSKQKDIVLDATAVFGGIKLIVPKNWKVESEGVAIFGGYDNYTNSPAKPVTTLHIKGAAIFGGVEIRN